MALLRPHARQAEKNHYQTLDKLRERGGLDPTEAVAILEDRKWQKMLIDEACKKLAALIASAE